MVIDQRETSAENMTLAALDEPVQQNARVVQEEALEFFYGPPELVAHAKRQTNYTIAFRPLYEANIIVRGSYLLYSYLKSMQLKLKLKLKLRPVT